MQYIHYLTNRALYPVYLIMCVDRFRAITRVHVLVFDFTDSLELVDLLGTIFPVYHNGSHGNQSVAFRLLQKTAS